MQNQLMATAAIKPRAKTACRLCRGEAVKTKGQWPMANSKPYTFSSGL